jgi:hypothetical protein
MKRFLASLLTYIAFAVEAEGGGGIFAEGVIESGSGFKFPDGTILVSPGQTDYSQLIQRVENLEKKIDGTICSLGKISAAYKGTDNHLTLGREGEGYGTTNFEFYFARYDLCLNSDNTYYVRVTDHREAQGLSNEGANTFNSHEIGEVIQGIYTLTNACVITFDVDPAEHMAMLGVPSMDIFVRQHKDQVKDNTPDNWLEGTFTQGTTMFTKTSDPNHSCTPY